jgi:hypothetical protein
MIHIVFNEPDIEVISKAIALDESLQGEILLIRDDFAVGPLTDIYSQEGISGRKDWWRMLLLEANTIEYRLQNKQKLGYSR